MRWVGCLVGSLVLASAPAQSIERAIADAEKLGARTGVAACDADGRVLYQHRAAEAFAPASNLKVLTAMAVLDGLGADFVFRTKFWLRGGELVVTASGDPNWISGTENAPEQVFGTVAAALQQRGVRAIRGIRLEHGSFTGPSRPAGWPKDQLQTYYCAPTGPFVLEQGTLSVAIAAVAGATEASVRLVAPPAAVPLSGSIALRARAKGATYGAQDTGTEVRVRGTFPQRSTPVTIRCAVQDPAAWYERALRTALTNAGITIGGVSSEGAAEVEDCLVHEHTSQLRPAIQRMLEDSSNFDAEQCLRVLGNQRRSDGSLAGALVAMREQIAARIGALPEGIVLCDGSGLSRDSLVTPGLLVVALHAANRGPGGALLRECLPVAGRSGTMSDRFTGTRLVGRVRAKTGWIRGVSALSGFVERADGSVRWFSILMDYEGKKIPNRDLKALQERIVAAIDAVEPAR